MTPGTHQHTAHIVALPAFTATWMSPQNLWCAGLSALSALAAATVAITRSLSAELTVTVSLTAAAVTMIGVGVHRHRPDRPAPWYLLAASAIPFTAAATLRERTGSAAASLDELVTPVGYLAVCAAALLWLWPWRGARRDEPIPDVGVIALGALLAAWTFLISPALPDIRHWDISAGMLPVFAVIDTVLLTVLAYSTITSARPGPSPTLIHLALSAILIAVIAAHPRLGAPAQPAPHLPEFLLLPAYAAAAFAALHPSMTLLGSSGRQRRRHRSRQRAGAVTVTLVATALIPVIGNQLSILDRVVVTCLLTALVAAVVLRGELAIVRSVRGERRARYQADHDMLTGLISRSALLRSPARDHPAWSGPVCLLFLDLDGFKAVNDHHGHAVGDELIADAAARIRRVIRRDDLVARYGGDEFVVVTGAGRTEGAILAQQLLAAFDTPFELSVARIEITVSIGITYRGVPVTRATVYDLLCEADSAMYHAKAYGLGRAFHADMANAVDVTTPGNSRTTGPRLPAIHYSDSSSSTRRACSSSACNCSTLAR
ncbi:MAG: GGDEF domain-containing protein [Nocardia sp.]|nr:GGDEF domain-containing protein [Nocardia sp.]